MEEGPSKTLEEAVESVRRYQRVQVEAYNNQAKRPRANVQGWSLEREDIDSWDHYSSRRGDRGSQLLLREFPNGAVVCRARFTVTGIQEI